MLLAVRGEAAALKALCCALEDGLPLGRLFDMDVIGPRGEKLSRGEAAERGCLVCGKPGRGCASRRLHPVEELQRATRALIRGHWIQAQSEEIASLAVQALLDEAAAAPKPGLVDRYGSGSHGDMDLFTFGASAAALWPYFQKCFLCGDACGRLEAHAAFAPLRALGLEAERRMLMATEGVNTHKGAIYTLGLLCAAAGRLAPAAPGEQGPDAARWLTACADLAAADPGRGDGADMTHGELARERHGAGGVREELKRGLPGVANVGLPALEAAENSGYSLNDACLYVLLRLMTTLQDTNMIHRGGLQRAREAQAEARALLERSAGGPPSRQELEALDARFTADRLSPGGSADLLAATLFVHRWLRRGTVY